MKRTDKITLVKSLLLWVAASLLCYLLVGCRTQFVTVPEYHTIIRTDTVNTHDSIIVKVRELVRGDTVYRDSIHYRDRWKEKIVYRTVHDSVPYPVEVERIVYKRSSYYTFTSWFFWVVVVICALATAWLVFKKFYLKK